MITLRRAVPHRHGHRAGDKRKRRPHQYGRASSWQLAALAILAILPRAGAGVSQAIALFALSARSAGAQGPTCTPQQARDWAAATECSWPRLPGLLGLACLPAS